jgi:pimeloyl-ACP methyl ester carboxylesterase
MWLRRSTATTPPSASWWPTQRWRAPAWRPSRGPYYPSPYWSLRADVWSTRYERSVAVLVALLDRLGLAKAALVGNSVGGRIAWRFAAEHPARLDPAHAGKQFERVVCEDRRKRHRDRGINR